VIVEGEPVTKIKERMEGFFGEAIAFVIGWTTGVAILAGAFVLSRWAAPFIWDGNPDILGLLSTIVVLWIYEHRHIEERFDNLERRLPSSPG
jgi:hypothetical protein